MRVKTDYYGGVRVWLSGCDTAEWANNPAHHWRNSTLAGREIYAELSDTGEILDTSVDGSRHAAYNDLEMRCLLNATMAESGVMV